jgi:DNA-binding NtrC family response regulator
VKPRLLILDDQTQYLRSLERALRGEFDVRLAASQAEANAMLSGDVALVLTDIRLDESSGNDRQGLDFIRNARERFPELPIIAMSALDATDVEDAAQLAGATKFIHKPIVVTRLKQLLQEVRGLPKGKCA